MTRGEAVPSRQMETKLKHLEFIQGVVNRMADASFRVKRWSVILVSALVVLTIEAGSVTMGLVALVPVLIFWRLDGYYLGQERLFRALYNRVRVKNEKDIDFSMDVCDCTTSELSGWRRTMGSRTQCPFYTMLLAMLVAATVVVCLTRNGQ